MEFTNSLNCCLEHIAPFSVIIFSVGSANNLEQQYPSYLDELLSRGKNILVIIIDPEIEEVPLFTTKRTFTVHRTDTYTQYMTSGLRYLVFKECFSTRQNANHMTTLHSCIERCMDHGSLFLYTEYTGQDNFVLQESLHQKYGNDSRFHAYIDCGTVSGNGPDGRPQSSCVLESKPIFTVDYNRVIPVDTMEIDELLPFVGHPRVNSRIMRSILKLVDGDCVALRQYAGGDQIATWIQLHVCNREMFEGERSYEPYIRVRDSLLTLLPLFTDEIQRMSFEFIVSDLVNMTKENRYEWINMMSAFVRGFSSSY